MQMRVFDYQKAKRRKEKVKQNVRQLYDLYPETIQNDTELILTYFRVYHNLTPGMDFRFICEYLQRTPVSIESITRAGRYWRQNHPLLYPRSTDSEEAHARQELYKEVFSYGEI